MPHLRMAKAASQTAAHARLPPITPRRMPWRVRLRSRRSSTSDPPDLHHRRPATAPPTTEHVRDGDEYHGPGDAGGHQARTRRLGGLLELPTDLPKLGLDVLGGDPVLRLCCAHAPAPLLARALPRPLEMAAPASTATVSPVRAQIPYGTHVRFPVKVVPVSSWSPRSSPTSSRVRPITMTIDP